MSRGPQKIRKTDVEKVVKAARDAGVDVSSVEVDVDGRIIVVAGSRIKIDAEANEWDEVTG